MKKRLLILVFIVFWTIWIFGCEQMDSILALQKPKASLASVKFGEINLTKTTLLFDVEIENPYSVGLPLTNMDYSLSSNDKSLLSGSAKLASIIEAKSTKKVTLPATISYLDAAKAFMGIKPGSQIPYKADLAMSVDTPALGTISLPTTKQGQLNVPTIPKIDEINWGEVIEKVVK